MRRFLQEILEKKSDNEILDSKVIDLLYHWRDNTTTEVLVHNEWLSGRLCRGI